MNLSNPAAHIEAANLNMNGEWDMYATQARWSELVIQPGSSDGYSLVSSSIVVFELDTSVPHMSNMCVSSTRTRE